MEFEINEENLKENNIEEIKTKVRALLIDENNQILVANYNNVIMLPGGKIGASEKNLEALIRELYEEIGVVYKEEELKYLGVLNHYQTNYPKRDGGFYNRLVKTYFYIGIYKGINTKKQILSDKEKQSNFKLELVSLENLESIILNNKNANPRNEYFQKELLTILTCYNNYKNII